MRTPDLERLRPSTQEMSDLGRIERIYRFPNNYGASVIRFPFSLWELAVIRFNSSDILDFDLISEPLINDDAVIGYLTDERVDELLDKIEKLKSDKLD
jgi:hypothetical protein